jgi:hypothetical protein
VPRKLPTCPAFIDMDGPRGMPVRYHEFPKGICDVGLQKAPPSAKRRRQNVIACLWQFG